MKIDVSVLRVFTNSKGEYGSKVGIVIDENSVLSSDKRLEITRKLGFSETIFINSLLDANVSIFSKQGEIPFASPLLGSVWFIEQHTGKQIGELICRDNKICVLHKDNMTWLNVPDVSILPEWRLEQVKSPDDIDATNASHRDPNDHNFVWAWEDEGKGIVRARTFAPAWQIPEEEANGSGSMLLAYTLNRSLKIDHGKGSVIDVLLNDNCVSISGRVNGDGDSCSKV